MQHKRRSIGLSLIVLTVLAVQCSEDFSNPADPDATATIPEAPFNLRTQVFADTLIRLTWDARQNYGFRIYRNDELLTTVPKNDVSLSLEVKSYSTLDRSFLVTADSIRYSVSALLPNGNETSAETGTRIILGPPTDFRITSKSRSEIRLEWTDNSAFETGFRIERRKGTSGNWVVRTTTPPNTTFFVDTLTAEIPQTYQFQLTAISAKTSASPIATETNFELFPPGSLHVTQTDTTRVDLSWSKNNLFALGFTVQRASTAGISDPSNYVWITRATQGENDTTFSEKPDFNSSETIAYRILANGTTVQQQGVTRTVAFPAKPGPVSVTLQTNLSLKVDWTKNSTVATQTVLYRKIGNRAEAELTRVNPLVQSYTDSGPFPADSSILYRVTHVYQSFVSRSEQNQFTISMPAPTNLTAQEISSSGVFLQWTDNSAIEHGFRVYRAVDENAFTLLTTRTGTTYQDNTISAETMSRVRYRVTAYAGALETAPADVIELSRKFNGIASAGTVTGTEWAGEFTVSPNGQFIAGGFRQGHVWQASTMTKLRDFNLNSGLARSNSIRKVRWGGNTHLAFLSSLDQNSFFDHGAFVFTGTNFATQSVFIPIPSQFFWFWDMDIAHDGSLLAIARQDSSIFVYNTATSMLISQHKMAQEVYNFRFHPTDKTQIFYREGSNLTQIRLSDKSEVRNFGGTGDFYFNHDGSVLLRNSFSNQRTFFAHDVTTGQEIWSLDARSTSSDVQISRDRKMVGVVYINPLNSTQLKFRLLQFEGLTELTDMVIPTTQAFNSFTFGFVFHPDGKRILIALDGEKLIYALQYTFEQTEP
jgi:hypothetical protein